MYSWVLEAVDDDMSDIRQNLAFVLDVGREVIEELIDGGRLVRFYVRA